MGRRNVRRRSHYCNTPETEVDKLDDDLLGEILIRLPLKTVVGFKVINKRWYTVISDPHFANKHTSRQTNPDNCTFFSTSRIIRIIRTSFNHSSPNLLTQTRISLGLPEPFPKHREVHMMASCHGLLMILVQVYNDRAYDYICIFNPLTKKKRLIPSPPEKRGGCFCTYGLVFGPTSSSPYYHNHYNVVFLDCGKSSFKFKVFNPEKERWIESKKTTRINYGSNGLNQRSVNSCSYPVCFRGIVLWFSDNGVIIAFNADKDESKVIQIPMSISELAVNITQPYYYRVVPLKRCLWLGVVEDELNLVVCIPPNEVFIWVLDDYENNKWKLKRKVVIKGELKPRIGYMQPIFFDGERLVVHHPMTCDSYRQEHNIRTGISRTLCMVEPLGFHYVSTLTEVQGATKATKRLL